MFEPKRKWFYEIDWEDRTVLLKGILSIKEEDYGRFTELALGAGMVEALAEEVGDWTFPEEDGPRGVLEWLGFSVHEGEEGEARVPPKSLSPFVPSNQGVPRQVGSRDVRMEERQALRCRHNEGDVRRWDLLLCAEDRRQWGLFFGRELWKALGAAWEGHRNTGGPSLACGGFAACRRYGGYYIPTILAL